MKLREIVLHLNHAVEDIASDLPPEQWVEWVMFVIELLEAEAGDINDRARFLERVYSAILVRRNKVEEEVGNSPAVYSLQ